MEDGVAAPRTPARGTPRGAGALSMPSSAALCAHRGRRRGTRRDRRARASPGNRPSTDRFLAASNAGAPRRRSAPPSSATSPDAIPAASVWTARTRAPGMPMRSKSAAAIAAASGNTRRSSGSSNGRRSPHRSTTRPDDRARAGDRHLLPHDRGDRHLGAVDRARNAEPGIVTHGRSQRPGRAATRRPPASGSASRSRQAGAPGASPRVRRSCTSCRRKVAPTCVPPTRQAHHAGTVGEPERAGVRGAVVGLEAGNEARAEELEQGAWPSNGARHANRTCIVPGAAVVCRPFLRSSGRRGRVHLADRVVELADAFANPRRERDVGEAHVRWSR